MASVPLVKAATKAQEDTALLATCAYVFVTTIKALAVRICAWLVCALRARASQLVGKMLALSAQLRTIVPPRAIANRKHDMRGVIASLNDRGWFRSYFSEQHGDKVEQSEVPLRQPIFVAVEDVSINDSKVNAMKQNPWLPALCSVVGCISSQEKVGQVRTTHGFVVDLAHRGPWNELLAILLPDRLFAIPLTRVLIRGPSMKNMDGLVIYPRRYE